MLVFTPVLLWISVFLLRLNFTTAVECEEMMIKYDPSGLLALRNCTSILGSLTLMSLEDLNSPEGINKYQFPNLKEITGYLLLFNVYGLNSAGKLFPNLTVIRGQQLVQSYSLVIFSLPHLTEVGFKSLISIQRGYVFIERCPALCYHNTINWEALTDEDEEDLGAGKGNVIQSATPKCPTRESCRSCDNDNCWSSHHCQKNKTSNVKKGLKCHKLCLGGCVNDTAEGCNVCTKLTFNGKCVEECPKDLLLFRDTMRCISKQTCINYRFIPFKGECRKQCPDSYSQYNPATKTRHHNECFKCEIKCEQRCYGLEIRGASDLEHFRGCTIVVGSLSIKLGLNMTDINEKLEETLGNIETINGALRIYRSFSLTSLAFFRNLNKINAGNATSMARDHAPLSYPYALEITENDNLQRLFDWKEKLQFEIVGGGMSFHFNAKLCVNEIHSLQDITYGPEYNRSHDSIEYDTNGYDEICHATGIFAFHVVTSHSNVQIYWNISDFGSNKRLIGYFVYYIEAPSHNITYFSGLDACSTKKFRHSSFNHEELPMISKKSNSEIWQSTFVPFEDLTRKEQYFEMTLTDLKQNTQYAYYVRTQLSYKIKDQLINVTQGQSQVKYFTTLPDRPRPPIVRTKHKTNESITLEWNPSTPENELVQKHVIDVYVLIDDADEINKRDYCQNPKENTDNREDVTKTPEVICCRDQRAYLEFFQRDYNQTCGPADPRCESAFKFVLFHHHVENALLMADLQKDPSQRYQYKREPFESPKHHKGTTDPIQRKYESDHSKVYLHSHIIDDQQTDSVVVPNLKPFHLYAFYVFACNNISNCSDYYFHSDRTESDINADDIMILAIPDDTRTDIITLIIQPPIEPNAVTISYEIELIDYTRNIANVTCITRNNMEAMNYTIRFENLLYGSHSFRVRSVSLGEDGSYSDVVMVDVDRLPHDSFTLGIVLSFCVIIGLIIITIVGKKCRAYRTRRRADDTDCLLTEEERRDSSVDQSTNDDIYTKVLLSNLLRNEAATSTENQRGESSKLNVSSASDEEQQPYDLTPDDDMPITIFRSNVSRNEPVMSTESQRRDSTARLISQLNQSSSSEEEQQPFDLTPDDDIPAGFRTKVYRNDNSTSTDHILQLSSHDITVHAPPSRFLQVSPTTDKSPLRTDSESGEEKEYEFPALPQ